MIDVARSARYARRNPTRSVVPESPRKPRQRRRQNITANQVVADQVKALRSKRNVSQQQLANKIGETQSTVARIESGARSVTVDELFRISWALDVAPLELLAASFQPCEVPIIGKLRLTPSEAREWVRGARPLLGGDVRAYFENVSDEVATARREAWQRQEQEPLAPHTFRLGSPDPRERYEAQASLTELVLAGVAEAGDDESARAVEQLRSVKAWLDSRAAKEATDA
ncbi:MAG TPA: helix-turn-helix transcriptional regulator [Gaiellaceae bacterium]|nr:helix-turn-helix transcriptional regulator [Gaiellaceae bacterium]